MIVLGISPLDKDSTVSIVVDGKVAFAAGEERFTRNKLQDGFPTESLQAGLKHTGIRLEDIDVVAYPFFDWQRETELFNKNIKDEQKFLNDALRENTCAQIAAALARVPLRDQLIPGLRNCNEKMEKPFVHKIFYRLAGVESVVSRNIARRGSDAWSHGAMKYHKIWQDDLEENLKELGLQDKLKRFDHHLAHSAAAFFASGLERALIVTLDGYGSGLAGSVCVGEGARIRRIHKLEYPHSLGTFYESVTSSLGFKPSRHEGKIVGLAAYGDPEILLDTILSRFDQQPGNFRIRESNNIYFSRYLATLFPKIDVAAAYQRALEVVATNYIRHHVQQTGIGAVVFAGGVAANVKLNQRIFEIPEVKHIFIYPNMGDGGCGTGAAFLVSRKIMQKREPYQAVYFGPDYNDAVIIQELRAAGLAFKKVTPIEPVVAKLIHDGKVVARFNGRMEYGPRALGNRSILYRATEPEVNQWLNQRLGRTEFMPFAPATLLEERHRCYNNIDGAEHAAQFMTITFNCTGFMKRNCPAAVHVDGTARPQLIQKEANPSFYRIVREYYQLSGIPSVINTSFNMHEEPIVNSPADAIRAFLQGNLDYLAIEDFLIRHPMQTTSGRVLDLSLSPSPKYCDAGFLFSVKQPIVSFVIPVLNGEKDIARCLASIRNQDFPPEEYEVFVVDNGSIDQTHQIVRDLGFNIEVVPGVTVAALRNRGAALAVGEYLAFVDADVELKPCWLRAALAAYEDPRVVAAGCFPGVPQPATWVQQTWDVHQHARTCERGPTAWLPSMNLLVRRGAFLKITGFNEQLKTTEDVDLCYRLGQHGMILCNPAMEATHWGEAGNLRSFFRKEAWRGTSNLKGVLMHGLRRDELPSIGYPLYILCCVALFILSCSLDLRSGQFKLIPSNLVLLWLPALVLAINTSRRTRRSSKLPQLLLLYLVYGLARAYSIVKTGVLAFK